MAEIQVTNTVASQSLIGEAVKVTVNQSDSAELVNFAAGMLCTNDAAGNTGTINRVDYKGNSFTVNPIQPNLTFGTYGYLAASATVTVSTT
jgi:hypothetical protein